MDFDTEDGDKIGSIDCCPVDMDEDEDDHDFNGGANASLVVLRAHRNNAVAKKQFGILIVNRIATVNSKLQSIYSCPCYFLSFKETLYL